MKSERIYQAIGFAGDDLLEKCDCAFKKRERRWRRWTALAACFCAAVAVVFLIGKELSVRRWPVKEVPMTTSSSEITALPHWDDLTESQQYSFLNWSGIEYSKTVKIDGQRIGQNLGLGTLTALNWETDESYQMEGEIYEISKISPQCAVAVWFEQEEGYFVYINGGYHPETLGQFLTDLNLEEIMSFGSVWYSDSSRSIEFPEVEDQLIWKMLLSDPSLPAVDDYDTSVLGGFVREMDISVDIPLLGYRNISLAVTKDGYLTTNILSTGKAFYLGEEKVRQFVSYVLNHCEGYEIVYTEEPASAVPESGMAASQENAP